MFWKKKEKALEKFPVICLRTGKESYAMLSEAQIRSGKNVLCPITSLEAIPLNVVGVSRGFQRLLKDVAALRNRVDVLEHILEDPEEGPRGE